MAEPNSTDQLGFREWTAHYEKEQEADREKINEIASIVGSLGSQVSKLSANMETLIDNQKGMFNRMNRPWQWGVVVAVFMGLFSMSGMFGTVLVLSLNPINNSVAQMQTTHQLDVQRNLELHMWFRETLANMQVGDAEAATDIDWLMRMEDRLNARIHEGLDK